MSVVIQLALAASDENPSQQPQRRVLVVGQEDQTETGDAGLPASRTTQPHPRHEHARHVKPQLIPHLTTHTVGKLELNPNGQWAWIKPTRHLITAAIADLLTEGPSR